MKSTEPNNAAWSRSVTSKPEPPAPANAPESGTKGWYGPPRNQRTLKPYKAETLNAKPKNLEEEEWRPQQMQEYLYVRICI